MDDRSERERISLVVLMSCNLKCKNCVEQAPYYERKYHPTLDFLKAEIDRLFQIADTIRFFSIEGGEALLRDDFGEILGYLDKYKEQIGVEIPIVTNGTIVPDRATIDAAKALGEKARFIVDDYGPISSRVEEIAAVLGEDHIRYTVRNYDDECYCGGWVDLYGDYGRKWDRAGAEDLHSRCAWVQKLKGVMEIIGGRIYFCPPSRVYYERGLAAAEDEVIRFMDLPVETAREQIRALFQKRSLSACRYCNGIHDGSVRYKPAVQMTDEELAKSWRSREIYRESL